jgi:hypothetical protein
MGIKVHKKIKVRANVMIQYWRNQTAPREKPRSTGEGLS